MLAIGLVLRSLPFLAALVLAGASSAFVDQGLFFSGTALVTFGGAYPVLAFVAQRAVEVHDWLTPREMVRGLALAETTPGRLIMVVQFVPFLGAYRNPGGLDPWVAATLADLAVFFAVHTMFDDTSRETRGPLDLELPILDSVRPASLTIALAAAVMTFRLRWSVRRTLGACAALGLFAGAAGVGF